MSTVALAKLVRGDAKQRLILPGNIEPYYKAVIYARVSGYLKSWQQDIGGHVTAGQLLASIDTPDLDQQLDQAKADLATADANERLAAVTAKRFTALVGREVVSQQAMDEKAADAAAKESHRGLRPGECAAAGSARILQKHRRPLRWHSHSAQY